MDQESRLTDEFPIHKRMVRGHWTIGPVEEGDSGVFLSDEGIAALRELLDKQKENPNWSISMNYMNKAIIILLCDTSKTDA